MRNTKIIGTAVCALGVVLSAPLAAQEIQSRMVDGNPANSEISLSYRIYNKSTSSLDLAGKAVRYYMTESASKNYQSDIWFYSHGDKSGVTVRVPTDCGSSSKCFDVQFSSGVVQPSGFAEVSFRLHTENWDAINEADDLSYLASNEFSVNAKLALLSATTPASSAVASSSIAASSASVVVPPVLGFASTKIRLPGPNVSKTFSHGSIQELELTGYPTGWSYNTIQLQFNTSGQEMDAELVVRGMRYQVKGYTSTIKLPYKGEPITSVMFISKSGITPNVRTLFWVDNSGERSSGVPISGAQLEITAFEEWKNLTLNPSAEIFWSGLGLKQGDIIKISMKSTDGKSSDVLGTIGGFPITFAGGNSDVNWLLQDIHGADRLILNASENRNIQVSIQKMPAAPEVVVPVQQVVIPGTNTIEATYDFSVIPELASLPSIKVEIPEGTLVNNVAPIVERISEIPKIKLAPGSILLGLNFRITAEVVADKWIHFQLPVPPGLTENALKQFALVRFSEDETEYNIIIPDSIKQGIAYFTTDHFCSLGSFVRGVGDGLSSIGSGASTAWDYGVDGVQWLGGKTVDAYNYIEKKAKNLTISIGKFIGKLSDFFVNLFKCIIEAVVVRGVEWTVDAMTNPIVSAIDVLIPNTPQKLATNIQVSPLGSPNRTGEDKALVELMVVQLEATANRAPESVANLSDKDRLAASKRNAEIILADIILSLVKTGWTRLYTSSQQISPNPISTVYSAAISAANMAASENIYYRKTDGTILNIDMKFENAELARAMKDLGVCELVICGAAATGGTLPFQPTPWGIEDASQCAQAIQTVTDKAHLLTGEGKDDIFLQSSELLANLSMIMWLSDADRTHNLRKVAHFASELALWTTSISPAYFDNNIPMKAYSALLLFQLPQQKKTMLTGSYIGTEFSQGTNTWVNTILQGKGLQQMINAKFTPYGGYAEGTGYLHFLNKEMLSMFSIALQNGWITQAEVPDAFRQSGYWLKNQADPSGNIHPMDDGKAGSKFWLAPYATLTGDPSFITYQAKMLETNPQVDAGRVILPDFTPLQFLAYPWNVASPATQVANDYLSLFPMTSAVDGVLKLQGKAPWAGFFRSLSMLSENGQLLDAGGSHDQQDNSSIEITAWAKGTSPVSMVADPGYQGFQPQINERMKTSAFGVHNVVTIDGGGVVGNRELTEAELYSLISDLLPDLDLTVSTIKLVDAGFDVLGAGHPISSFAITKAYKEWGGYTAGGGAAAHLVAYSNDRIQGHRIVQIYDAVSGSSHIWSGKAHGYRSAFQWDDDMLVMDQVYQLPGHAYQAQYLLPLNKLPDNQTYPNTYRFESKGYKIQSSLWSPEMVGFTPSPSLKSFPDKTDERSPDATCALDPNDATKEICNLNFNWLKLPIVAPQNTSHDYVRYLSTFQVTLNSASDPIPWIRSTRCSGSTLCLEKKEGNSLKIVYLNEKAIAPNVYSFTINQTSENVSVTTAGEMGFLEFDASTKQLKFAYQPSISSIEHNYNLSPTVTGTNSVSVAGQEVVSNPSNVNDLVIVQGADESSLVVYNGLVQSVVKNNKFKGKKANLVFLPMILLQ